MHLVECKQGGPEKEEEDRGRQGDPDAQQDAVARGPGIGRREDLLHEGLVAELLEYARQTHADEYAEGRLMKVPIPGHGVELAPGGGQVQDRSEEHTSELQ